jgi:hypothetical protein
MTRLFFLSLVVALASSVPTDEVKTIADFRLQVCRVWMLSVGPIFGDGP